MAHERSRKFDVERRRGLSIRILQHEHEAFANFQDESLRERSTYYPAGSFTEQMNGWVNVMSAWVTAQKDPQAMSLLQSVGLAGDIKNDDEQKARITTFYTTYLNPTEKTGEATKLLIDTLVGQASKESGGDVEKTIAMLEKVSPLFAVTGVDSQHLLSALAVAKVHALHNPDEIKDNAKDQELSPDEQVVWEKLRPTIEQVLKQAFQEKFGKPYSDDDFLHQRLTDEEIDFLKKKTEELSHEYYSGSTALPDEDFVVVDDRKETPESAPIARGTTPEEFLRGFDSLTDQRPDMRIADSSKMEEFSTT